MSGRIVHGIVNNCKNKCSLKLLPTGDEAVFLFAALWVAAALLFGTAAVASGPIYLAAAVVFAVWLAVIGVPSLRRRALARNR